MAEHANGSLEKAILQLLDVLDEARKGTVDFLFPVKPREPEKTCVCRTCGFRHYPMRK